MALKNIGDREYRVVEIGNVPTPLTPHSRIYKVVLTERVVRNEDTEVARSYSEEFAKRAAKALNEAEGL